MKINSQGKIHDRVEYTDFFARINTSAQEEEECNKFRIDLLGHSMETAAPYIFPFIIEFALIGAIVANTMSEHIGKRLIDFENSQLHFGVLKRWFGFAMLQMWVRRIENLFT